MNQPNYNTKTRQVLIERYNKQISRMARLERAYVTHAARYYAKDKRQNLLSNQFQQVRSFNPYTASDKDLKTMLRSNAAAVRTLGVNSAMSGDRAEGHVLVELNNEAYFQTTWQYGDENNEHALDRQAEILGDILFDSLKHLRLTPYELTAIMNRSVLPNKVVVRVKNSLRAHWKEQRR